jgi:hypothetical protein
MIYEAIPTFNALFTERLRIATQDTRRLAKGSCGISQ